MLIDTDALKEVLTKTHLPYAAKQLDGHLDRIKEIERVWMCYYSAGCFDKQNPALIQGAGSA